MSDPTSPDPAPRTGSSPDPVTTENRAAPEPKPAPDNAPTVPVEETKAAEKPKAADQPASPPTDAAGNKPADAKTEAAAEKPAEVEPVADGEKPADTAEDTDGEKKAAADGAKDKHADGEQAAAADKDADGEQAAAADKHADGEQAGAGEKAAAEGAGKKKWYQRLKLRRNPWLTVGGVVVVLLALAVVGYLWGLGPLNRLNTARGITPPAKLAGLERITDEEIRGRLQLDQTREALSRINDGKQATVEAYGALDGSRIYVVIALRGKVDVDKTIQDSGASSDQVKQVGKSTCVESSGNLPTQCYRSSSTLTVIAQVANEGIGVDTVGPVADEAFNVMK